ncbi:low temperature requirement protein A [Micromonospora sp. NPDC051006]|uniref:low temperature requirement protein A n=1 Tax=Micromonospora sp. NPDC051006 TaxID=3364283 RepID=UPI0037A3A2E6
MASAPERLLRHREDPVSASFLELFFDLAFVLALSQLASMLLADLDVGGALRTALLLAALWWVWVSTTWFTDWFAPSAAVVRFILVAAALGSLLMGAAVPQALGDRALLFAGAFVALNVGRNVLTSLLLRGHPRRPRSLRILFWFCASGVLWLAGALVPAARVPLWLTAMATDYVGPSIGWPTPGLGRARGDELRLTGGHLSERFQQIFIISLGELILVAGVAYAATDIGPAQTAAFLLVFTMAVLTGLLYITPAGGHLGQALERADPSRLGPASAYLHLVMVGGVVATAVGAKLAIAHPTEPGAVAVVVAGPALFLTGRLLLSAAINRRFSWPRLAALPALLVVGLLTAGLPLLVATAATAAILLVAAVLERTGVFAPRERG